METAYGRYERTERGGARRTRAGLARARRGGRAVPSLGKREKRRLIQLFVCVLIFATVFFGKGISRTGAGQMRQTVLSVIQADTDFKTAFLNLGQAIAAGEPALDTLEGLLSDVLGRGTVTVSFARPREHAPTYQAELAFLRAPSDLQTILNRRLSDSWLDVIPEAAAPAAQPAAQEEQPPPAAAVLPAVPVYNGPALPEGSTMDRLPLGLAQSMAPVMGVVSSGFGYRDHPIDGENKFHYGIDLVAETGTPIRAFADGVVDYIGESEAYGQYIQLRHAGGVTSFYAHCSKLCAQKGQKVSMGDIIAEVGATGNVTGAHLHLELRLDGTYINPAYYVESE